MYTHVNSVSENSPHSLKCCIFRADFFVLWLFHYLQQAFSVVGPLIGSHSRQAQVTFVGLRQVNNFAVWTENVICRLFPSRYDRCSSMCFSAGRPRSLEYYTEWAKTQRDHSTFSPNVYSTLRKIIMPTTMGQRSIMYKGSQLWYSLPDYFRYSGIDLKRPCRNTV